MVANGEQPSTRVRFDAKVKRLHTGCWLWTGARSNKRRRFTSLAKKLVRGGLSQKAAEAQVAETERTFAEGDPVWLLKDGEPDYFGHVEVVNPAGSIVVRFDTEKGLERRTVLNDPEVIEHDGGTGNMFDVDRDQVLQATRISWHLYLPKPADEKLKVFPTCTLPHCVAPEHLVMSNTMPGHRPNATLTPELVLWMRGRRTFPKGRPTFNELAARTGLSIEAVRQIAMGTPEGRSIEVSPRDRKLIQQAYQPTPTIREVMDDLPERVRGTVSQSAVASAIAGRTWKGLDGESSG